mgnify:CR=1 FL=1
MLSEVDVLAALATLARLLALGAWLVIRGEMTGGAMVASSILMGRALSPIEMAVGQWAVVQRAQEGWARLSELFTRVPQEPPRTQLPRPKADLEAQKAATAALVALALLLVKKRS